MRVSTRSSTKRNKEIENTSDQQTLYNVCEVIKYSDIKKYPKFKMTSYDCFIKHGLSQLFPRLEALVDKIKSSKYKWHPVSKFLNLSVLALKH